MGRKILAVIVGIIAALAVIMIVQMMNALIVPPPPAEVMNDAGRLAAYMVAMPTAAYIVVLIGYVLGSFAGGFIVTKMSRKVGGSQTLAVVIGVVLMIAGILNFFILVPGQPIWFVAASLLSYVPLAWLGYRVAR
ncbi:MAG: hypothetical protein WKF34_12995 [Pyrinomonadaceae bacterium]